MKAKVASVEPIQGGAQLALELTFEREGGDKPVCVAETLRAASTKRLKQRRQLGHVGEHARAVEAGGGRRPGVAERGHPGGQRGLDARR